MPEIATFERRLTAACWFRRALGRKNKGPGKPGPLTLSRNRRLLERVGDRVEVRRQLGADALNGGDDRDRDAGGNQAVFDGGGAGLILHETRNEILHR